MAEIKCDNCEWKGKTKEVDWKLYATSVLDDKCICPKCKADLNMIKKPYDRTHPKIGKLYNMLKHKYKLAEKQCMYYAFLWKRQHDLSSNKMLLWEKNKGKIEAYGAAIEYIEEMFGFKTMGKSYSKIVEERHKAMNRKKENAIIYNRNRDFT